MNILRPSLLAGCLAVTCCLSLRTAEACINGVERHRDPAVENLQRAERLLREGNPEEAARLALRSFPKPRAARLERSALGQRALRVFALAVVRTGGTWSADGPLTGAEAREENRRWAVLKLRQRSIARALDPAAATDLGEALARHLDSEDEGRHILEELAKRDVITTAEGWAALALLRGKAGDVQGRKAAENECRKKAVRPAACGGQAQS